MSDPNELTPREKFHASLFQDPDALFRKTLFRKLTFLVVSLGFMIAWLIAHDPVCAFIGYGILFYQVVKSIFHAKQGIKNANRIYSKYESQINEKKGPT